MFESFSVTDDKKLAFLCCSMCVKYLETGVLNSGECVGVNTSLSGFVRELFCCLFFESRYFETDFFVSQHLLSFVFCVCVCVSGV